MPRRSSRHLLAAAALAALLLAGGPGSSPRPAGASFVTRACGLSTASLVFTAVDVADAGLDYAFAAELSAQGFTKEAAWMGVQATLALGVELLVKLPLHRAKHRADSFGALDLEESYAQTMFVLAASMLELGVFLLEDCTTVLIWWRTGTFDSGNPVSLANMVLTLVCSASVVVGLVGALVQASKLEQQIQAAAE